MGSRFTARGEGDGEMIGINDKERTLRSVTLFKGCSNREIAMISRLCTEVQVDHGTVQTSQGRQAEAVPARSN